MYGFSLYSASCNRDIYTRSLIFASLEMAKDGQEPLPGLT